VSDAPAAIVIHPAERIATEVFHHFNAQSHSFSSALRMRLLYSVAQRRRGRVAAPAAVAAHFGRYDGTMDVLACA
jgi:predicted DNA-binding ribbon-helix-helix protein